MAAALGAALLAGCEGPLPDEALLTPQPAPRCEPKGVARKQAASADASDDAARLRKLDYEAQCYRHAEMIARTRLGRLQDSMRASKADSNKSASNAPFPDVPP